MKSFLSILSIVLFLSPLFGQSLVWPTPNSAFLEGKPIDQFIQSTASGEVTSGLFGCVRNNGNRFHEALDLGPILPRKNGEATDPIFAAYNGTVVHVNAISGKSSYGRYIVIEHETIRPRVYTLYAHLARIGDGIEVGSKVKGGEVIGIMGRSAGGYVIPRSRAHLHFEIGLRLTDRFQSWYDRQDFGSKNDHGNYNGMNLIGWDPLDFYKMNRDHGVMTPFDYMNQLEPGFVLRVKTAVTPDFVRRYPELQIAGATENERMGWEVRFTAWGLPLTFKALGSSNFSELDSEGSSYLVSVNPEQLDAFACRQMIRKVGDTYIVGKGAEDLLELLFE